MVTIAISMVTFPKEKDFVIVVIIQVAVVASHMAIRRNERLVVDVWPRVFRDFCIACVSSLSRPAVFTVQDSLEFYCTFLMKRKI